MSKKEWFGEWFGSPYYFKLYKNRDTEEARFFLDNLLTALKPDSDCRIMDLACGKGRHAIYLNDKGYDVTGLDLQEENITYASQFANERLRFHQHDMREVFREQAFDLVLNLFTSFGYFDTRDEHQQTVTAVAQSLRPGGRFVLDFLNPYSVIHDLTPEETKTVEGIEFHIKRSFDGEFILKDINFEDEGTSYSYREKVQAIRRVEFIEYFEHAGMKPIRVFGDYHLKPYQPEQSERLIFVTQLWH